VTESLKQDKEIDKIINEFEQAMDDDFNTARALAVVHKFINLINERIGIEEYLPWLKLAREKMIGLLDNILGLKYIPSGFQRQLDSAKIIMDEINDEKVGKNKDWQKAYPDMEKIIKYKRDREQARKNKDWPESDRIRSELEKIGFVVEDTPQGTRLRRKG
jgi:cysteinyl-tRNA synthetase